MHRNILDHRDLFNSIFKIEPMKEKTNVGLRSISWVDARKHAEEEGKRNLLQTHLELKIRITINII